MEMSCRPYSDYYENRAQLAALTMKIIFHLKPPGNDPLVLLTDEDKKSAVCC